MTFKDIFIFDIENRMPFFVLHQSCQIFKEKASKYAFESIKKNGKLHLTNFFPIVKLLNFISIPQKVDFKRAGFSQLAFDEKVVNIYKYIEFSLLSDFIDYPM